MGKHTNNFNKGMTSDMDVVYQPQGTYRYARNVNLISQDGENYVLKDCLGNVKLTEINKAYATVTVGPTAVTYQANPMVIGYISFPDKLIVFSTNAESVDGDGNPVGGYGEIGMIKIENYGQGIQPIAVSGNNNNGYVPLYHHVDLDFTKLKRIEGFAYQETDEIQRVYWTDNFNEPRVFNVGDPTFTTYIATGSLVVGQQYMVVEGAITHNAVQYAPGIAAGNIFTAANANYTDLLSPTTTAKVIEYYPLQLLNFTPSRSMGNIKFKEYGAGSVYCGGKIYFYRLSQPSEGIYTSWSYGSSLVHVGTDNSVTAVPANPFFDFTGGGSSSTLVNSGNSVVLTIDNIDTNYTNIEVAVAEYNQATDVIYAINIIANELITSVTVTTPSYGYGTTVEITHSGSDNLGELSQSDITLFPASILKCKTITTNKNYCLIANVEERPEFQDFDKSTVTTSQIYHRIRAHQSEYGAAGTAQVCENVLSYNIPTNSSVNPSTAANPALVNGIQPYTEWIVTTGIATYNGTAYGPAQPAGQFFRGVLGQYNWANTSGTAVVRPAVFKNQYTTIAAVNKPTGIQFNANESYQWNYKNPAVDLLKRGYWSNQTYRFGILFYDLKGNPFYVRHLADFTFADCISQPLTELIQVNSGGDDDWYLKQNGISFSGITIPASIIDLISGFSIVRAERDATIMTQGMLMQVAFNSPSMVNLPSPNLAADSAWVNNNGQCFTYVCPDNLVQYQVPNYATGSNMDLSHWVIPRTLAGINMKASSDGGNAIETKYLEVAAAEAVPAAQSLEILALANLNEAESISSFGSGNWQYFNSQSFGAAVSAVDTACSAPVALANTASAGSPRTLIEVDGAFYGYNQGGVTNYGDITNANLNKMIANVSVVKTNLYGGQSDAALANTFYISTGHFQPITAQVKADTLSGGDYVFNNVDVYGGDCYNCLVTLGHSLADVTGANIPPFTPGANATHSWGIKFACQCNSNYDLKAGRLVEANRMYPAATGVVYNNGTANPTLLEGFSYNKGYSSQGLNFLYPALPASFSSSGQFRYRIRYAGEKFPAETVDSFRVFNLLDFKDTDGHGGEINNLKTKDGRTVVWQNKSVDTVPILERQIVSGQSGEATTIGTGGVVDRFDPITSDNGNQHQWGLTEAPYGYFWFDMRKKAFVILDFGAGIQDVSLAEGLSAYFSEAFLEVTGFGAATTNVLNSQTFDETSDRPLVGVGITGAYDPKFKMSYLTFKFYSREPESGGIDHLNKDFTIGYYHPSKMFTSFYDWTPAIAHNHNQWVFASNNPKNKTKYYGAGMNSTTFEVGDVVAYNNAEYICYTSVTITSYPGTAPQLPDAVGSAYWSRINQTHEIWVNNMPKTLGLDPAPDYEYSKFFGQVVNGEVTLIINPEEAQNPFSVTNIEQHGNNEYPTAIYTETTYDSAQDLNITTTRRNYQWIYNLIASNLPLNSNGVRLTDAYLQVKIYKKNWSTVPYTRTRDPKILEMVVSYYEEKR